MDLYKAKYSDKKFDRHSKTNPTPSRNSRGDEPLRSYRNSKYERPSRDRYSRDERPSRDRYSRDEQRSRQDDFKTHKSEKFLKKSESFYSNGSEKFYSSLKEKLFEILGGKVCSSCGFKDERALGFNHINDEDAFDSIRRGGFASSWGKYISEPELARKDLRVLCLNCNEIRQPQVKTEPKKPKFLNKKSRYFPR